ncbi:bacterio-opsin activator [Halobacteriales archaeon QS_4_70_19]|nr:MAG: bacterio-opsin activator [Halobacteriales archaeon QS_4_70_19]
MQYVTFTLRPEGGWFYDVGRVLFEDPETTAAAIHHIGLLEDDTVVSLYEVYGDGERVRDRVAGLGDVIDCQYTQVGDGVLLHIHSEPTETLRALLAIPRQYEITLDTPLSFAADGGVQVTVVGEASVLGEAVTACRELTSVSIDRTGSYRPDDDRLLAELTERQREVLRVAWELGYYEIPREATYEDIAERLGCTTATVGQHFQRIEATLLGALASRLGAPPSS